jgi:hypothetical protein
MADGKIVHIEIDVWGATLNLTLGDAGVISLWDQNQPKVRSVWRQPQKPKRFVSKPGPVPASGKWIERRR